MCRGPGFAAKPVALRAIGDVAVPDSRSLNQSAGGGRLHAVDELRRAWLAAAKIARLSALRTSSQWAM
jgi:hypothetical protein